MAELARGTVNDRPWGRTFASLGLRGLTGQVTIAGDGKRYAVAFSHGAVVAAISPLAADAAVRVALTGGLVTSTQIADIMRRQQATPNRDEIELIGELARLGPDQALRLRRRVVAQRAARTFSIERGDFMVEDQISLDVVPGTELDVRAVVYLGARYNVSDQRLAAGVGQFGSWFKIRQDALLDLPQFGFADDEQPVIAHLLEGAELQELERCAPDIEQRMVRAMVYALVACNACDTNVAARAATPPPVEAPRQPVARGIPAPGSRVPQATVRGAQPARPTVPPPASDDMLTLEPATSRTTTAQTRAPAFVAPQPSARAPSPTSPPRTATAPAARLPNAPAPAPPARTAAAPTTPPRTTTGPRADATPVPQRPTPQPGRLPQRAAFRQSGTTPDARAELDLELAPMAAAPVISARTAATTNVPPLGQRKRMVADPHQQIAEVHALIAARAKLVDDHADHYTMLGVDPLATAEVIRKAYFAIARQLHPDRLSALGIPDDDKRAQRLFAHVNTAFGVLSSPARREEYNAVMKRGGESALRAEDAAAEQMALKILEAEEAFRRGELAMRRDRIDEAIVEFKRAMELNPGEADYNALLAWALFCHASDKQVAAQTVRRALTTSIRKSPNSIAPRFYLGRVERMLGRDQEAREHFREVLELAPNHSEAISEIRYLDSRLNPNQKSKR